MAHELQGTFNGLELWYDSDILYAWYDSVTSSRAYVSFKLNEGLYFKESIQFTLKRNARADFNFVRPTYDSSVTGGYYVRTIDSVEYYFGLDGLNATRDSGTYKMEIIVNPDDIINLEPEPEPEPEPTPSEPETEKPNEKPDEGNEEEVTPEPSEPTDNPDENEAEETEPSEPETPSEPDDKADEEDINEGTSEDEQTTEQPEEQPDDNTTDNEDKIEEE